jgi:DNA-binding PadR family transcriptional regulator
MVLLADEPATGYRLGQRLRDELAYLRTARLQQIYGELAALVRDGYATFEVIETPPRRATSRKRYSLTDPGRRALGAWLERRPERLQARDELLIKLLCFRPAMRRLFIRRLEERKEDCLADLRSLRLRLDDASRRGAAPLALGPQLCLEAAAAGVEAQLRWCEDALSRIEAAGEAE